MKSVDLIDILEAHIYALVYYCFGYIPTIIYKVVERIISLPIEIVLGTWHQASGRRNLIGCEKNM